jgi:hypothetical protein
MAFERVTCEVYFLINVNEIYSELRHVNDYPGMEFETRADADRFLAEEGYSREEAGGTSWKKSQAYRHAYVTRHLREVKE